MSRLGKRLSARGIMLMSSQIRVDVATQPIWKGVIPLDASLISAKSLHGNNQGCLVCSVMLQTIL